MATWTEAVAIARSAVAKDIVAAAKAKNAEILNTDPRPLGYIRYVDGIEGAQEESVKDGGIIVYEYNRYDIVAQFILDTLRQRSPVKDGDYVRSHTMYLNGREVQELTAFKQGDEIAITNYVPYARKIEVGVMKMTVPGHVYERTAQIARRLYKDVADISFTYRGIVNGAQVNALNVPVLRPVKNKRTGRFESQGGVNQHNKSSLRFPTITLNPPGSFSRRTGF